ncbi:Baculovirus repeated ORF 5 [Trabala vishnou gigantina nucleopolyhedrovirus]|uniref:Baculovirus repeated ORF 5 n=1 Tax=Trabala vishnou gigantina nucleopolyhedrovirus TaxID=2863583 RepID=UPI002481D363|nr:Baculovirus repeated ORF 5 [Trabala vishnou gigantina nucleopolyhedrovirus]QYC92669.1 Baculovirus repeated ORF 5 [Trabala vishnou gigantina nucleopolyhedrovirus]
MSLVNRKFNFGEVVCDLWIVEMENDKFMYGGHAIAEFLGYKQPDKALRDHVKLRWKTKYEDIKARLNRPGLVTSPDQVELPPNWQPNTVFISEAGVYALIMRSKLPAAEEFQRWLFEEVLPELRKTGKYDVQNQQTTSTEVVNYNKQLADAQMESMRLKLELSNANTIIAKYDTTISEIKLNYEKQIAELKERECHMQLAMSNLSAAANMTMTQFAVNALLAKDNIEENTQMRQTLAGISGRVAPDMTSQPEKEEYITGYERMVNGRRRIRMCRSQLNEIEQQDKAINKFREQAQQQQQQQPPDKKAKLTNCKRYAWLRDSEKFLQLKCPNPVAVWLKVRAEQPHLFYGLRYTNKLKTEMEVLEERELREKYRRDADMCERNKLIHSKLIEEFKTLELRDEDDCVERCMTPALEAKERINAIVEGIVENMSKELVPATAQRKHDNAGDVYTAEQVVHAMHNCTNYFVKNINLHFYAGPPPPSPTPPTPLPIQSSNAQNN